MSSYKNDVVKIAIEGLVHGGMSEVVAKSFSNLFDKVYQAGYNECLRNIKNKQVSEYIDKYTDIISDGGMDPR